MLSICHDPEIINSIANHPSILPYVQHIVVGEIDLTSLIGNKNNVCLLGEYGCVLFHKIGFGVFEFHTMVLPEGRGQWAYKGGKWAFNYMFTHTDAFELLTRCPDGNLASKALSKLLGMRKMFRTLPNFKIGDKFVGCDVKSMMLQDWIVTDEMVTTSGEWFHECLESEYKRLGINIKVHSVDHEHDRYVGATVEMLRNGQINKAIAFYSRWAYIAGYEPISVVSLDPLIIDIKEAKLKVLSDGFEVICPLELQPSSQP